MKVAIYGRVSTQDQHVDNQVLELRKYCNARTLTVWREFLDIGISGSKESRPQFDLMMNEARKRKFDVLIVWKLDRLSRSLKHLLNTLDELNALNISFIDYSNNLDTTTAQGRLMFQMVGAFAEFERSLIRERVKLGLQHAKAKGKQLGRPKLDVDTNKLFNLRNDGLSIRKIATALHISIGSVHKTLAEI